MSTELLELAQTLETEAQNFLENHETKLKNLTNSINTIHGSWSGSNLGYHADVYYRGFSEPPAGAFFSVESAEIHTVLTL